MSIKTVEKSIEEKKIDADLAYRDHVAKRNNLRMDTLAMGQKIPAWLKETRDEESFTERQGGFDVTKVTISREEFKGSPMLKFSGMDKENKYPFSFGLKKAKVVLAFSNEIAAFVAEHDGK